MPSQVIEEVERKREKIIALNIKEFEKTEKGAAPVSRARFPPEWSVLTILCLRHVVH